MPGSTSSATSNRVSLSLEEVLKMSAQLKLPSRSLSDLLELSWRRFCAELEQNFRCNLSMSRKLIAIGGGRGRGRGRGSDSSSDSGEEKALAVDDDDDDDDEKLLGDLTQELAGTMKANLVHLSAILVKMKHVATMLDEIRDADLRQRVEAGEKTFETMHSMHVEIARFFDMMLQRTGSSLSDLDDDDDDDDDEQDEEKKEADEEGRRGKRVDLTAPRRNSF